MTEDKNQETIRFRNPVKAVGFAQLCHVITLDPEISDGAYRLYALYLMYAQQGVKCWPARDTLAGKYGKDNSTITRHNQELESAGYITRQRRFGKTSITWIEDADQLPRLQALAKEIFERREERKNEPSNSAKMSRRIAQKCAAEEEPMKKNHTNNKTPVTAPPSGNGKNLGKISENSQYHIIDLDEEIRAGVQVPRNQVQVSCPVCQASVTQQMDKCPDCGAVIIWKGSNAWTGRYGSVKKYIRKLKGISLKPLTDYEREFVKFFGRSHEFISEKQAADARWLQAHKPEPMLMSQIDWGVQKGRAWQQVVAAGKNPATLERYNARSRANGDDYELSEEQAEESLQESERLLAEMAAAGGQEAWTEQLLRG